MRILIVEDNGDLAEALSKTLQGHGHECQIANDAYEALSVAGTLRPQFVLMDICMPYLDGFHAAKQLRELEGLSDAVIYAMTFLPVDGSELQAAGMDGCLHKPISFSDLPALADKISQQVN